MTHKFEATDNNDLYTTNDSLNMKSETKYIKVAESPEEDPIEVPCEDDNTIGLKYKSLESGAMRGLRLIDNKLQAPEEGFSSIDTFFCVFPKDNKRKLDDESETGTVKKRAEKKISDLIVLGLAWKTSDKELKEYFEKYGEISMAQVKRDPKTGQSKGFGFVRFTDFENQSKVTEKRHCIDGRWCDVRVPLSRDADGRIVHENNKKIFIGRLTSDVSLDDLREYFTKFGEVEDVFSPKPFRGFAFVTFKDHETTQKICETDHIIKNVSVYVSNAVPKSEMRFERPGGPGGYGSDYYQGGGGGGGGGGSNYYYTNNNGVRPSYGNGSSMPGGGRSYYSSGGAAHHNSGWSNPPSSHVGGGGGGHYHTSSYSPPPYDYYSNRSGAPPPTAARTAGGYESGNVPPPTQATPSQAYQRYSSYGSASGATSNYY